MCSTVLQVFQPLLFGVRDAVSAASVLDDKIMEGYFVLSELCDIKEGTTNGRPICQMVCIVNDFGRVVLLWLID